MRGASIVLLSLLCGQAFAGLIFGSINVHNQPLSQHDLAVECSRDTYPGRTNDNGSYSINALETGRCTLVVQYGGDKATFDMFSERNPSRNDLTLIRENDHWVLRRR